MGVGLHESLGTLQGIANSPFVTGIAARRDTRCHQQQDKNQEDVVLTLFHTSTENLLRRYNAIGEIARKTPKKSRQYIRTGWCRTTPLWGRGLSLRLTGAEDRLHDCRARNEIEAIMWHAYSSESDAYDSALQFYNLSKEDRDAIVLFLRAI